MRQCFTGVCKDVLCKIYRCLWRCARQDLQVFVKICYTRFTGVCKDIFDMCFTHTSHMLRNWYFLQWIKRCLPSSSSKTGSLDTLGARLPAVGGGLGDSPSSVSLKYTGIPLLTNKMMENTLVTEVLCRVKWWTNYLNFI